MVEAYENTRTNKIEAFEEAIDAYRSSGNRMGESAFLACLGELFGRIGRLRDAHAAICRGLDYVNRSGEHFAEAELLRIKGNLHILEGEDTAAELAYSGSLAVSAAQNAKSWELRTLLAQATSRPKAGDAITSSLGATCEWFGNQSSLPELAEANALLRVQTNFQ